MGPGLVATVVLTAVMVAPAAAQPALDRVLGNAPSGLPFTVAGQWPQLVGSLARATGVPIGVESVNLSLVPPVGTRLTGLTLRDALDTLAREAGYEWREMDGVIVLRPRRAWVALSHPLDIEVEPVRLEEAIAQQALALACAVLGASDSPQMPERRRFSFTFPGGRLIDFLNAVAREHGSLAWSFARTPQNGPGFPFTLSLSSGTSGVGCGVPGLKPAAPVDLQRVLARKAVPAGPTENVLDRLVGLGVHDQPLRLHGIHESGLRDLATAARVPMGVEKVEGRPLIYSEGFVATGAPLRLVLDALVTIDPRYEWRLLDGVVVFRPLAAWDDPENPLAVRADATRLLDEAEDRKATGLGHRLWWLAGGTGRGIPVR